MNDFKKFKKPLIITTINGLKYEQQLNKSEPYFLMSGKQRLNWWWIVIFLFERLKKCNCCWCTTTSSLMELPANQLPMRKVLSPSMGTQDSGCFTVFLISHPRRTHKATIPFPPLDWSTARPCFVSAYHSLKLISSVIYSEPVRVTLVSLPVSYFLGTVHILRKPPRGGGVRKTDKMLTLPIVKWPFNITDAYRGRK